MPLFSRDGDSWIRRRHRAAMSGSHDPIAKPGSLRDPGGQAIVTGGLS